MAVPLPPCQECGACCVVEYDDGYYADLDEKDEKRMGAARLKRMTVQIGHAYYGEEPHRATATKTNRQGHVVCKALRGSVGSRCSCGIYAFRPKVCRKFSRGSKGCLGARRMLDLPV